MCPATTSRPVAINISASAREAAAWLKRHWLHFLIAPAMLIVFTTLHESAHAVAALVQGADIVEFVVWPSAGKWGYVSYVFPSGPPASRFAISAAPYAMWAISIACVALASRRKSGWPLWAASTMYLWGFVGAFGDIVNAWIGWAIYGSQTNDWAHACGPTTSLVPQLLLLAAGLTMIPAGYIVQKNLYRTTPLSPLAYAILVALLLLAGLSLMVLI